MRKAKPYPKAYSERTYKRNVRLQRLDKTVDRELVERSFNVHSFKGHLFTDCACSERAYTRNVLIQSERSQGERQDKRRAYVTHKPILQRLQLVAIVCLLVFVFLFTTRQKLRFHLSYSHPSSLVFDVREPLCVKYENAWHCVAQAATQAKWHNKGTILIYASAACLPRERRITL